MNEKGNAIFLPLERSFLELQKSTRRALLNHQHSHPYRVLHQIECYPDAIGRLLEAPEIIFEVIHPFEACIADEEGGVLSCIALTEPCANRRLLLHKGRERLLAACLPVPDYAEAYKEHQLMYELSQIAEKAGSFRVLLDKAFFPGEYSLKKLLKVIADSMK